MDLFMFVSFKHYVFEAYKKNLQWSHTTRLNCKYLLSRNQEGTGNSDLGGGSFALTCYQSRLAFTGVLFS